MYKNKCVYVETLTYPIPGVVGQRPIEYLVGQGYRHQVPEAVPVAVTYCYPLSDRQYVPALYVAVDAITIIGVAGVLVIGPRADAQAAGQGTLVGHVG